MVTKLLKISGLFLLLATLTGCPGGEEDCFDIGSTTRVDNLIKIEPLQTTYNQGDVITFKTEVQAFNNYFGEPINLFEKTNDFEALLVLGFDQLFADNELTYIKGTQSNFSNWFNVPYNLETGNYELEIQVMLNKIGYYSFSTNDSFQFQGSTECNRYFIDTNVEGWNSDGKIEFNVQ